MTANERIAKAGDKRASKLHAEPPVARTAVVPTPAAFEVLLDYLKTCRGFDFTGYKRSSLLRRVAKRMATLPQIDTHRAYHDYLEVHPEEFTHLFNTILINVTDFFRDPHAWEFLAEEVIPQIVRGKRGGEPIRVCSAGCASGQEPYSAAMLFAKALRGREEFRDRVKIYATDVDDEALSYARHAVYTAKEVASVPEALRKKYFEKTPSNQFMVRPDLRRAVIFGRHDLVQDAPISRLDLLICRNTLMYFNAETQRRVLARFHFALNETGFLFLGKSEMLLSQDTLFETVNLKQRVFAKVPKVNLRDRLMVMAQAGDSEASNQLGRHVRIREAAFEVVPIAQLVIDANGRLALASGAARKMFGITAAEIGRPLQDLELSYRPVELRSLIDRVHAERQPQTVTHVKRATADGKVQYLDVEVAPLEANGGQAPAAVAVSFLDVSRDQELQETLRQSNEELETANEELQSTNEELETTNEELQSTNEELETTNEELQSTNEELETMNEELQSTNEELETTNDELHLRTDELNQTNTFLNSIMSTLRVGVAVTDEKLEVRAWNAKAEDLWGVRANEVHGKSIFNLDIGLPIEKMTTTLRACLAEEKHDENTVLEAIDRRGNAIHCRVTCKSFVATPGERGVILFMEETA